MAERAIGEAGAPLWKAPRGSYTLEHELEKARQLIADRKEKQIAKTRDGRCRWPERHKCLGVQEAAHVKDASRGGLCVSENLIRTCSWIHRRGPESIHGKQLRVDVETAAGTWGACSFWRNTSRTADPNWHLVKREIRPFEYERD